MERWNKRTGGRGEATHSEQKEVSGIDDYAKDCGDELLPICIALYDRIPVESLMISNLNAMHLGKNLLATIFSVIVY